MSTETSIEVNRELAEACDNYPGAFFTVADSDVVRAVARKFGVSVSLVEDSWDYYRQCKHLYRTRLSSAGS